MNQQTSQQAFTPDAVFNLVRSNPQAMAFVENLARSQNLQQAVQQYQQPTMYQQTPTQPTQGLWDTGQTQPQSQQQAPGDMLGMAMGIVEEFRKCFKALDENLKLTHDKVEELAEENARLQKTHSDQLKTLHGLLNK